MKRQIEISASFTGKISTGTYENSSPFYAVKEIIEIDELYDEPPFFTDKDIDIRQKQLHDICYQQFKSFADVAYSEKIAKTYQNIRFYDGLNGIKYPSVTSIINLDENFFTPPDELAQMAARGTIIHKQVEIFLMTGEWKSPKDIPEIAPDYLTVIKGSLSLDIEDVDFRAFYAEYPFKTLNQEQIVLNHEHRFGGRYDIKCIIDSNNKGKWEKIEGILFDTPLLIDVKTSTVLDKTKGFTQGSAYAMCDPEIKQIVLCHLNKEVQRGFSIPALTTNLDRYQAIFKNKRNQFKTRYAI